VKTYDIVMLVVFAVWWFTFRKKYDWRAVIIFYVCGVMLADVLCAGLILFLYRRHPEVLLAPAMLMPIGGIIGLAYGVKTNGLMKGSRLFKHE